PTNRRWRRIGVHRHASLDFTVSAIRANARASRAAQDVTGSAGGAGRPARHVRQWDRVWSAESGAEYFGESCQSLENVTSVARHGSGSPAASKATTRTTCANEPALSRLRDILSLGSGRRATPVPQQSAHLRA